MNNTSEKAGAFPIGMIGGTGRSGTTILGELLGRHPGVASVPEWRFLVDPDGILDFYAAVLSGWSPYHGHLRLQRLESLLKDVAAGPSGLPYRFLRRLDRMFGRVLMPRYAGVRCAEHCPGFARHSHRLLQDLAQFRYEGQWSGSHFGERKQMVYGCRDREKVKTALAVFLTEVYSEVLRQQDKRFYLEKNTWNILWFDKMLELCPQSKLIHIVRDPRDVLVSYMRQAWVPASMQQSAVIITDLMAEWKSRKAVLPEGSFLEVRFEDLVRDKKQTARELLDFFDLEWSPEVLDVKLEEGNIGKWKSRIEARQLDTINELFAPILKDYGYEVS